MAYHRWMESGRRAKLIWPLCFRDKVVVLLEPNDFVSALMKKPVWWVQPAQWLPAFTHPDTGKPFPGGTSPLCVPEEYMRMLPEITDKDVATQAQMLRRPT